MKNLFFFLIPILSLVILFRYFNKAGYLNIENFLMILQDFDFDFDNTVNFLKDFKNLWSGIDFFPTSVDSISTFFKAIGNFFVAIYDFLRACVGSLRIVFVLFADIVEVFLSVLNVVFRLFGFNSVATSTVTP